MAVTAQSIISRVRTQLIDTNPSSQHWSDAELLQWLSDGQRALVGMAPNASSVRVTVSLAQGVEQNIPADGYMLLDVECNVSGTTPGRAIRKSEEAALDAFSPNWRSDPATPVVKNWLYNPMMQTQFYVYPPNDGTGKAQLIYSQLPTEMTALTDTIVVNPIYQTALYNFVMYCAMLKDTDFAGGSTAAAAYFTAFQTLVAGSNQTQQQTQPNASGAT